MLKFISLGKYLYAEDNGGLPSKSSRAVALIVNTILKLVKGLLEGEKTDRSLLQYLRSTVRNI